MTETSAKEQQNSWGDEDQLRTIKRLLPYLWPRDKPLYQLFVVLAIFMLVAANIATVLVPLILGWAVDALSIPAGVSKVIVLPLGLIIAYGAARVATQLFGEMRDTLFAPVGQLAIRRVALKTFEHMHALSLRFHLDRQTGGLSRVIERGVKGIDFLLNFMLFNILPTLMQILIVCTILWTSFDWRYAVTTLVALASYIFFTIVMTEWRLKYRREMNKQDTEANTKAIDSLLNYETVKYFGNEAHEAKRYDRSLASYQRAAVDARLSLTWLNVGQAVIIAMGATVVMLMAAGEVVAGRSSVGDFVAANAFLIQLYIPLNFLGFVYREIKQSLVDMDAMFNLLEVNREIADAPGAKPLAVDGAALSFKDVGFSYNNERQILKDLSFELDPGQTLAVVGPSGSGKSTLGRLLYRFYDVSHGAIKIDGQDLREITQDSLRAAIGIVPQDSVLFNDTIGYNIAYGRPEASQEEVEQAAKLASIHDFIMGLPEGYKTRVGERGLKLSGGERQRVAIARTILKAPSILLFDEATSALDSSTERDIQRALRAVSKGRTTLVIAHRLSTVVDADKIVVLKEGRIAEQGNHDILLAKQGLYAKMWTMQQESQHGEG